MQTVYDVRIKPNEATRQQLDERGYHASYGWYKLGVIAAPNHMEAAAKIRNNPKLRALFSAGTLALFADNWKVSHVEPQ